MMQSDRTLKYWDDYHESHEDNEWIVQPTPELFDLIFSQISRGNEKKNLRILEIGCGTSTMSRDLWKYIQGFKGIGLLHIRSTDVSQICVNACFLRDKDLTRVFGPGDNFEVRSGLEYCMLNILQPPSDSDRGAWDGIVDKACLDTFMFRSRQRGENKTYPKAVVTALDNIWTLLADHGVYILLSPRNKLKALRDFSGFMSVQRQTIQSEAKGLIVSKSTNQSRKMDTVESYYMYICQKNPDYVVGVTKAFKDSYRELPDDDAQCPHCKLRFEAFRKGEDPEGRGSFFWTRQWKNHCIHCKAPHLSKWSSADSVN